jgi:putative transposase
VSRLRKGQQQQVERAKIILLASSGTSNTEIAKSLGLDRNTVRCWRERWCEAAAGLAKVEQSGNEKQLLSAIEAVLSDSYRSGAPPTFSSEQVVQIIALACETDSDLAISHWTAKALATEAMKRGIVTSISPQSVARFLKGSRSEAASVSLLADE